MRNYLILLFAFSLSIGFSQKKTEDLGKISKLKLSEAKLLTDLINDIPKEYKTISIEMVGKSGGQIKIGKSNTIELNEELKNFLTKVDAGSKLYIDIVIDDQKSKVKAYTLHPTE